MDQTQLVSAIVSIVAERIVHTGTAASAALTDSAVDRCYGLLAARLHASTIGAYFLRALEAQPHDPTARRDVAQAVTAEVTADGAFGAELWNLASQLPVLPPAGHIPAPPAGGVPAPGNGPDSWPGNGLGNGPGNVLDSLRAKPRSALTLLVAAVGLMLISMALLANLVLPRLGLTEGARVDRVAGTWTGYDDGELVVVTIRPNGSVAFESEGWPCPGQITSPTRAEYRLEINCGIIRVSLGAELNLTGSKLTIRSSDGPDEMVLHRD